MFVHFLQSDADGPVKIGYTTDIDVRLGGLKSSNYSALHLIRVIEGVRATEACPPFNALACPRLYAFECARRLMLQRFYELVGSDEQSSDLLLDAAQATGSAMTGIVMIARDLPTQRDQTPPDAA